MPEVIRQKDRLIDRQTSNMVGDTMRNRGRGELEWRKCGGEETVITDHMGNGRDWIRQEVKMEESPAW